MKLSIIIPAYNEENTIEEIIKRVKNQKVLGLKKEIIVIDDGSRDHTAEILKKVPGINFIQHKINRGKGRAIRSGLEKVTGDIVIIQDADLELSPRDYPALVAPIKEGRSQVVYGSRLLGKKMTKHTLKYYLGGKFVTFIANLLYNIKITDEPIGYKVFRTQVIRDLNLECERFEFCPEVTAKIAKKKIKIIEVPVEYHPRSVKEGKKLQIKDGIKAVLVLLKYKFKS